jgi:hypothetical protein
MTSSPLVSIIINNFNYARYLPQCIDSALSQTHPGTEVVVVDDASTDGSRAVIARYGERIIPVLPERNGGQAAAMNAGFLKSRGKIVLFLDSDDYLYPRAVEQVVSTWTPGISKLHYRLDLVDRDGQRVDLFPAPEVRFDNGDVVPLLLSTGRYETTVTSGNAFSRAALERILPIPEGDFRISADGYLVTVVPLFGPVASIEEPLGAYRLHGENAWALRSTAIGERMRKALLHDAHRYQALSRKAHELGLEMAPLPGLRDHNHLATRISSLCMDPERHPYPSDTRLGLGLRGALQSRTARLPWARRVILATWFLAVAILPRTTAAKVAAWRVTPSARPPSVVRLFKVVRRTAR